MMNTPRTHSLRLDFYPCAPQIPLLRRFVCDFFGKLPIDPELVSRVAMSTHEMIENAMKYSIDGTARLEIDIAGDGEQAVSIRTINRASLGDIEALERQFAEMHEYEDSWDFYKLAMVRTAERVGGSGLGLARLRAEGDMTLDLTVRGDRVEIRASSKRIQVRAT
jgi:hypothetical protein